eukprot:SAG22_NODE_17831_length_297_cov_16.853535_1_plen_59_part_01
MPTLPPHPAPPRVRRDATSRRRCSHSAPDVGGKLHIVGRGQYHDVGTNAAAGARRLLLF